ncbi:hypothetical protein K1719_028321 [Acacia pycnantha]|nr:hypothetical protein K1719_028321 [Acacia pycnantha]
MIITTWNCRGAASKTFATVLRDLKHRYKVDLMVILEPRVSGNAAVKIIKSWGFKFSERVEAVGYSGGIWLLWNSEALSVDVLIDMETNGPFFTWKGPKWDGLERVFKRLDRCLCNVNWLEEFVDAKARVIPKVGSDHHPILIKTMVEHPRAGVRNFRFEVAWQMHSDFEHFLRNSWKEMVFQQRSTNIIGG